MAPQTPHLSDCPPPPSLETHSDTESASDPNAPVSFTGVKGKSKRAQGRGGSRKKRKGAGAPGPYTSWSGTMGHGWGREGRGQRGPSPLEF